MESINHESKTGLASEMAELWLLKKFNVEQSDEIFVNPKEYNYPTLRSAIENLNYSNCVYLVEWKADKTIFCTKKQLQKFIEHHNISYQNYQSGFLFKISVIGQKIKHILLVNVTKQIKKGLLFNRHYYMISYSEGRIVQ